MADAARDADAGGGQGLQFLTFRTGDQLYAVAAHTVLEVIRTPAVARVPHSPQGLLGVANLRGAVLPIASLRGLLGKDEATVTGAGRAIVLQGAAPVGLAVDAVDALVTVTSADVETRQAELVAVDGERLIGAFKRDDGAEVVKVLDLNALLASAFAQRVRTDAPTSGVVPHLDLAEGPAETASWRKLVTFDVSGQEFALELSVVREIVPAPEQTAAFPRSEALVLGMMSYRDSLLPLLSLHGLLGLEATAAQNRKVVVTTVGDVLVGLVADQMRAIVPMDPALVEPTPAMLAARTGGEAQIKEIYRGDNGRRLISILDSGQLFRKDVMTRLGSAQSANAAASGTTLSRAEVQFLVFRLGDDEFGLPIAAVDEVARAPVDITRLPKTPAFLEGVINLRGEVLPVIDQRRRFDMPPLPDGETRRMVVVRSNQHRAGLIVDSVSEVLRSPLDAIEPAPDLAGETTRLVHGVLNLEASARLILLLDPAELLNRTERGLLDRFQADETADG